MSLRMELQKRIDQSAAEYERYQQDPFQSHIYDAKKEQLETIQRRLKREGAAAALSWLRKELPRLESALEKEEVQPTFDWYNEHYHELVLTGRLEGIREAIRLLAEYLEGKN